MDQLRIRAKLPQPEGSFVPFLKKGLEGLLEADARSLLDKEIT